MSFRDLKPLYIELRFGNAKVTTDNISTHKHHSRTRKNKKNRRPLLAELDLLWYSWGGRWARQPQLDPVERLNCATWWLNGSTASPHTSAAVSANAPRRSTASLYYLIFVSLSHTHQIQIITISPVAYFSQ